MSDSPPVDTAGEPVFRPTPAPRRALALCGEADWCRRSASDLLASWEDAVRVDLADAAGAGLGAEIDLLVVDGFRGFDPDAFGRAVGAVRGGGLVLFLTPPLAEWAGRADPATAAMRVALWPEPATGGRFIARLARLMERSDDLVLVRPGDDLPALTPPAGKAVSRDAAGVPANPDQAQAIEAVEHVVTGHRRRPLVLTADRGRGKSAAFGLAAARLLQERCSRILVTAPGLRAADTLFDHAFRALPEARRRRGELQWKDRTLRFIAPDELLANPPDADLLLVDEAAAIPAAMLQRLLQRYSRIAFATTVHGYEGTGRGFAVRFNRILDREAPGWRGLALHTPVRWPEGDPVERLSFRSLLLDAQPAADAQVQAATPDRCRIARLDRDELADNERLLSELYGLMVLAHYRTRPFDLRYLLDGPNIAVYLLRYRDAVVATAWVAEEGGFGDEDLRAIFLGRRRPHGHLLPEVLSLYLGLPHAPALKCARVLRLAVHPAAQRRGLGTMLVQALIDRARAGGFDYLGSTFGATPDLLRFWFSAGFEAVRLGVRKGAASGEHSATLVLGLNAKGDALAAAARERFERQFPAQLGDALSDVDPQLVCTLWRGAGGRGEAPVLSDADWRDIEAFACGRRQYESCIEPVRALVLAAIGDAGEPPDDAERALLVKRVLQAGGWTGAAALAGLTGRAQALELMRRCARRWLRRWRGV